MFIQFWRPPRIVFDGETIETEIAPRIIGDRVFAPVRAIAEKLGAYVEWDERRREVRISKFPELEGDVWQGEVDIYDQRVYEAINVVNRYLAVLQAAVHGGVYEEYWMHILSKEAEAAGLERVWVPVGGVGSSVRFIPEYEIIDARYAGADPQGRHIYEVAARLVYVDLGMGEMIEWIKVYSVIVYEHRPDDPHGNILIPVIDRERIVSERRLSITRESM